jgi:hypothetical protein
MPLVSISLAQRRPLPGANFVGNVYHGLPPDLLKPAPTSAGGYLAFLGRISPEKRPERAIEIARRSGMKLKLAAKVDQADAEYFSRVVEPLIDGEQIEFIGEINDSNKCEFLSQASALLFPIDWPEPFGLVMIEAMACGTPVLAFRLDRFHKRSAARRKICGNAFRYRILRRRTTSSGQTTPADPPTAIP